MTIDPAFVRPADPSIWWEMRARLAQTRVPVPSRDLVCAMADHDLALEGPLRQRRRPDRFPSREGNEGQRHRDRRAHTVSLAHLEPSDCSNSPAKVSWGAR